MPTIGQTHRLTLHEPALRGLRVTSSLEDQARALWLALHRRAGDDHVDRGRPGKLVRVSAQSVVAGLFPDLSTEDVSVIADVARETLRHAGAARCLNPGQHRGPQVERVAPTWWVADELSPDFGAHAEHVYGNSRRAGEYRLLQELAHNPAASPHAPSPVTVTHVQADPPPTEALVEVPKRNPADALAESHRRRAAESRRMYAEVLKIVRDAEQPLAPNEVDALVTPRPEAREGTLSTTRSYLRRAVTEGLLFTRSETREERTLRAGGPVKAMRANIYSTQDPVPARTVAEAVPGVRLTPAAEHPLVGVAARNHEVKVKKQGKPAHHDAATRARLDEARADQLLRLMRSAEVPSEHWTQKRLYTALGVSKHEREKIMRSMQLLVDRGQVERARDFSDAVWRLVLRPVQAPEPAPEPEPTPAPALTGVVQPPEPVTLERQVETIRWHLDRLLDSAAQPVDTSELERLRAVIADYERRLADAAAELARLRAANAGLIASLTALQG